MDIESIYAVRQSAPILSTAILDVISKLKVSSKPAFRKTYQKRKEAENWRESILSEIVRKVKEKDDPDYHTVSSDLNKLTKQTYDKLIGDVLTRLQTRDGIFRLRVTTLLFDRGIRQIFYAPMMADAYREIIQVIPDAKDDLKTQMELFETLYDVKNVVVLPASTEKGYEEAVINWTKHKELKRGFAVYVTELYTRGLVPETTMTSFITVVVDDLRESIGHPKTDVKIEHVDALVRFLFESVSKVPGVKESIKTIVAIPKDQTPCLSMKSRFKLQDALV